MGKVNIERYSVMLAGVGGSGVVWNGMLLARAGARKFKYVTRFPNFTTAMRGGPCECIVVFSNREIDCPLATMTDAVIILENSQFKAYEERVYSGGVIILESTDLGVEEKRKDVRLVKIPAAEMAIGLGEPLVTGLFLLGAFIEVTELFPPEFIESELEARFGITETGVAASEKTAAAFTLNIEAFEKGREMGAIYKQRV